jgi:hypothetical protein
MPNDRREDRIREIDRRVAELDALLDKFRQNISSGKDPNVLSADAMIYWGDHQLSVTLCSRNATGRIDVFA